MWPVTGSTVIDLLMFLYAVIAPGMAIAAVVLDTRDPLVVGAVGATIGTFALPLSAFAVAMAFQTHISLGLIVGQGTLVLALAGAVHFWRRRSRAVSAAPSGS